ncbi:hypothetical protein D3C78_1511440 [compost metagenome]
MLEAMHGAMSQVRNSIGGNSPKLTLGGGGSNTANFNITINLSGTATDSDAKNIYGQLKPFLDKWARESQANKIRTSY